MARKYYLAAILMTAAAFVVTLIVYRSLPESVPTHWGFNSQPNGYSPKWTLFIFCPGLMLGMIVLFRLLPWLSPKHWDVSTFEKTYLQIMLIVVSLFAYFYGLILWVGSGHAINIGRALSGGICLLFILLGGLLGKVRRNFYIGVRTPWTLASERVWNETNRLAAKTMVASGLVGLALTAIGLYGWPMVAALLAGAVIPVAYSLVFYKQLAHRGEL